MTTKVIKILILIFVLSSCEKNEPLTINSTENPQKIEAKKYDPQVCGFNSSFCEISDHTPVLSLAPIIDDDNNTGIDVIVNSNNYTVYPFDMYDGSTALMVRFNNEMYVGHTSTDAYINSKRVTPNLPSRLNVLLEVEYNDNYEQQNVLNSISHYTNSSVQYSNGGYGIDITTTDKLYPNRCWLDNCV